MPKPRVPSYRLHKATGQAVVVLRGRSVYLGKYGTRRVKVEAAGMGYLYREVELPAAAVAARMRAAGVRVDVPLLFRLDLEITRLVGQTEEWVAAVRAGAEPPAEVLRNLGQLRTGATAVAALLRSVDPATDRVHPEIDPLGAATGRFACRNPALQSLPKVLREAVVAAPGHVLVEADHSQVELRVLAVLSGDRGLVDALRAGADLHRRTAALALGVPEHAVAPADRDRVGKAVNFGIVYGQTAYGLAGTLGLTEAEAGTPLARFLDAHPGVRAWADEVRAAASREGFVRTFYGRRRDLPGVRSADPAERAYALRQAVNTAVQGTAADVHKLALARLDRALGADGRLVLSVHDAVLVEAPAGRAGEAAGLVRRVLEQPPPGFPEPLPVRIGVGSTWAECGAAHPA